MESSVITQVQKEDVQVSPKTGEVRRPPLLLLCGGGGGGAWLVIGAVMVVVVVISIIYVNVKADFLKKTTPAFKLGFVLTCLFVYLFLNYDHFKGCSAPI